MEKEYLVVVLVVFLDLLHLHHPEFLHLHLHHHQIHQDLLDWVLVVPNHHIHHLLRLKSKVLLDRLL
jgi:hypothetical protein